MPWQNFKKCLNTQSRDEVVENWISGVEDERKRIKK